MTDIVARVTQGAPGIVAQVVTDSVEPPGTNPPIPDAFPVAFNAPLPYTIVARLADTSVEIQEGQSYEVRCVLTRVPPLAATVPLTINAATTADPANYTITRTQGGTEEVSEFLFGAGQAEASVWVNLGANFAEGTSRLLHLDIESDPTGYVDPVTGSGYRVAVIDGDFSTLLLTGTNSTSGTHFFTWGATNIMIPEDIQPPTVGLPVLMQPALDAGDDPVTLSITPTVNTSGPGFTLVDTSVTFQPGEAIQRVRFTVQNDTVDTPFDTEVDLELALTSGTASAGTNTTLTVFVVDDEPNNESARYVQWQTGIAVNVLEGAVTETLEAWIVDGNGAPATLGNLADVPVTIGGTATEGSDYGIDWGSSPAGYLRFPAGEFRQSITVRANVDDDDDAGETITLELLDDPSANNAWEARNQLDTLTITILEEASGLPTELLVPSHTSTATRTIQGLVAINPPSTTLPEYQLSTGENVQLVGMRRNGDDQWTAAYFYGEATNAESKPAQAGALSIGERTTGVDPASAGTFVTAPELTFSLFLDNVGSPLTTTTSVPFDTEWLAGVGESVEWDQTGPDLVRQRLTRHQFHVSTPTNTYLPSGSSAGQGAGLLELCETRFAGESEVILYEGRFGPCGWRGAVAGINIDGFSENVYCDGEMYVDQLSLSVGAGWNVQLIDAHPNTLGSGTPTCGLLSARASGGNPEPYWFGAGDSTTFWFAIVTSGAGAADALQRATDYVRKRNIAWSVGPLGVTENPIYNDAGDLQPDWREAGLFVPTQPNVTGWDAVEYMADQRETGAIAAWTAGSAIPGWGGGPRYGRTIQDATPAFGTSGGAGISGCFGWLPWAGYWYERMMLNHRIGGRIAHYVDVGDESGPRFNTSSPVWAWRNTQELAGTTRSKQQPNPNETQGGIRMFHFNDHRIRQQSTNGSAANFLDSADGYSTAPTSRAWNYPTEIASTLTLAQLYDAGGAPVSSGLEISRVDVTGTIPVTTPASGIITIERTDGYLHKCAYSSWSGTQFNITQEQSLAAFSDFRAQTSWAGATVRVYQGDPDEYRHADRAQHDMAHSARFRDGFVDQWWGMRSWLGLSVFQDMASRAVRTYNPWLPIRDYTSFNTRVACLGNFYLTEPGNTDWQNTGSFLTSYDQFGNQGSTQGIFGQQVRGVGWALASAAAYFQAAGDTERAEFRGQGEVASLARSRSWIDDMAGWVDYISTEYGVVGRDPDGSPNPWGSSAGGFYGPTNWATRTGTCPNPDYVNPPTPPTGVYPYLSGVLQFHNLYANNAVAALRQCFASGSTYYTAFERHARYATYQFTQHSNYLGTFPSGEQFATYIGVGGMGETTDLNGERQFRNGLYSANVPPGKITLSDYQTRTDCTWFIPAGTTRYKWAWITSQGGVREGDSQFLTIAKNLWDRPTASNAEFVNFLVTDLGLAARMAEGGALGPAGQEAFLVPLLAYTLTQL